MPRPRRWRSHKDKDKDANQAKGDKAPAASAAEAQPQPPGVVLAPLKVGQRVRLCEPFLPAGGRSNLGTVTRAGELVDVKWDDGRVSFMMSPVLVEPYTETEGKEPWRQ